MGVVQLAVGEDLCEVQVTYPTITPPATPVCVVNTKCEAIPDACLGTAKPGCAEIGNSNLDGNNPNAARMVCVTWGSLANTACPTLGVPSFEMYGCYTNALVLGLVFFALIC